MSNPTKALREFISKHPEALENFYHEHKTAIHSFCSNHKAACDAVWDFYHKVKAMKLA